jgi:uncharacterized protein DUF5681
MTKDAIEYQSDDVSPDDTGEKQASTRFRPGQSGNPRGRPKGSRNKLMEASIQALGEDFDVHGADAIRQFRMRDPGGYSKMVFNLHPRKVEAVLDATVTHDFENQSTTEILEIVAVEAGEEAAMTLAKMFDLEMPKLIDLNPEPKESPEQRVRRIEAERRNWEIK